ncbi:hypothetical protein BASA81_011194 [Batrachochytrium salamandrivorans]|nr:hypothetical protein BASA81_011194 [Batrachochytrium salamandrivorans]
MKATFGEINQEQVSETKLRALRQGGQPCAILLPRFLNGDRNSSTTLAHSTKPLPNQPVSRIHSQQQQQQYVDNYSRSPAQQPSAPTTATPLNNVQQHRTTDDMDIDFARRGPLTTAERQQRPANPLLELSTPITLRLADGDSSFFFNSSDRFHSITYWKACGDGHILCNRPFARFHSRYSWLERHNPRINWVSRMVEFDSPIA